MVHCFGKLILSYATTSPRKNVTRRQALITALKSIHFWLVKQFAYTYNWLIEATNHTFVGSPANKLAWDVRRTLHELVNPLAVARCLQTFSPKHPKWVYFAGRSIENAFCYLSNPRAWQYDFCPAQNSLFILYLACSMRAIIPAANGAAAEVPVCLSVQPVPVPRRQSVVT